MLFYYISLGCLLNYVQCWGTPLLKTVNMLDLINFPCWNSCIEIGFLRLAKILKGFECSNFTFISNSLTLWGTLLKGNADIPKVIIVPGHIFRLSRAHTTWLENIKGNYLQEINKSCKFWVIRNIDARNSTQQSLSQSSLLFLLIFFVFYFFCMLSHRT